jgi:hypothetical protein
LTEYWHYGVDIIIYDKDMDEGEATHEITEPVREKLANQTSTSLADELFIF